MSPRPLLLLAFHWYLESLHAGALRRARELGYEATVLNSDTAASLTHRPIAGIVGMLPPDATHPVRRLIATAGVPVVEFSLAYPENRDWLRLPEDCEKIGLLAAQRLRRTPAQSFLFVAGKCWWNHDAREAAFAAALADDPRPCETLRSVRLDEASVALVAEKLRSMPRPVAIFGSTDEWAKLALDGAELAGLRVPGEVYILGFGNRELISRMSGVPLSSISIDYEAWAAAGVDLLHAHLTGAAAPGTAQSYLPGTIVERASTGGTDPLCERALALMRAAVAKPPAVPELARRLGVSKATLERNFIAGTGASVARRFLEIRIEAAKALLATGAKIETAATDTGFDSVRGFTQAFTRVAGMTPGTFAKRRRSE